MPVQCLRGLAWLACFQIIIHRLVWARPGDCTKRARYDLIWQWEFTWTPKTIAILNAMRGCEVCFPYSICQSDWTRAKARQMLWRLDSRQFQWEAKVSLKQNQVRIFWKSSSTHKQNRFRSHFAQYSNASTLPARRCSTSYFMLSDARISR